MGWRRNEDGSGWFGSGGMPDWDKDAEDETYKPFSPLREVFEPAELREDDDDTPGGGLW